MKKPITLNGIRRMLISVLFVLYLLLPAGLNARATNDSQDSGIISEKDESRLLKLETITVTAEKREENIQEVPMAITAFTESELEDSGTKTVGDVVRSVPGLILETYGPPGWGMMSYRGVGNSAFTGKNPFVIFVDGIPFDDMGNYDLGLVDIERVEVLRGPQGTLYGKNAIGGVINIQSKMPDNEVKTKLTAEFDGNETYDLGISSSGPVIEDNLYLGLSGKYHESRGYMKNDNPDEDYFDSEKTTSAKTIIRWLPSDRLNIVLHAGMDEIRNGSSRNIASDSVQYHENKNPDDRSDTDNAQASLNATYPAGFAEFRSISTYIDTDKDYWEDTYFLNDGTASSFDRSNATSITQEFRVQSPTKNGGVKWLAGLFYADEKRETQEYGMVYDMTAYYGFDLKYDWPFEQEEKTQAVFGQLTVPILSTVNLTAGLRSENITKDLDYKGIVSNADTGTVLSDVEWSDSADWNATLPKAVLSWNPNKDCMTYFSVSKGYLAGGFNQTTDVKEEAKFDAQTTMNQEIGIKTAWMNNRLFLNANLFYVDIKDMHVWDYSNGIWIASNAAKAHSQGIEIEVKARPTYGLDISASLSRTESEFDDYGEYTGNNTLQTPEYTYSLAAQYRHSSGVFVRGATEGYGKTYYDEENSLVRAPYQLYHLKAGYEASNWDAYLFVENLLDEQYFSSMTYGYYFVGQPRTVGMAVAARF
jgi:iron complex outermembrane receptor protein